MTDELSDVGRIAWLVECPEYHPGEYFALCECGCGRHHWTKDVHKATKFESKEAAEQARGGDTYCVAVEHLFGLSLQPNKDGDAVYANVAAARLELSEAPDPPPQVRDAIKRLEDALAAITAMREDK